MKTKNSRKKVTIIVAMVAIVFTLAAIPLWVMFSSEKPVQKYKLPADNILGLTSITVYDKQMVLTFDQKKNDSCPVPLIHEGMDLSRRFDTYVSFTNTTGNVWAFSKIKQSRGKYIVETLLDYNKTFPERPAEATEIEIRYENIFITEEGITLSCTGTSDIDEETYYATVYTQTYRFDTKKWYPLQMETSIDRKENHIIYD